MNIKLIKLNIKNLSVNHYVHQINAFKLVILKFILLQTKNLNYLIK